MNVNNNSPKILTLNNTTFTNGIISCGISECCNLNKGQILFLQSDNEDSANLFLHGIYGETNPINGERLYYSTNGEISSTVFSNDTLIRSDFSTLFLDTRNKIIYNNNLTTLSRWNSLFRDDSPTVKEFLLSVLNNNCPLHSVLKIKSLLNKQTISLSSGEIQRILLYKTLLTPAKIILIEQPLAGLDADTKNNFISWLNNYNDNPTLILADTSDYLKDDIKKIKLFSRFLNKAINQSSSINNENVKSKPTSNNVPLINLSHVTISYNTTNILNDFSLRIFPMQRWLLSGHNGSGKTTILSLISGDNPQIYKNDVKINGKTIKEMTSIWEWRLNVGAVNNDLLFGINPTLKVSDVILSGFTQTTEPLPSILNNKDKVERCNKLRDLIIPSISLTSLYGQLSRVDKLKVLFIRSVIHCPKILLLDELEVGLTYDDYQQLIKIIGDYIVGNNLACILSTHYLSDIPEWITNRIELC